MELFISLLYKLFIMLLLLVTLPLQLVIAAFIVLTSGWPILYDQRRIGRNNTVFTFYKFRTMAVGAEKAQKKYAHLNEADGPVFKIHNDPRFTAVGRFLSHTGLDELPQLVNVLKGEMALIGPRPLPVGEAAQLKPWQQKRYAIKPGIISPWILEGYHTTSFVAWMKSDLAYIQKKNIWYDSAMFLKVCLFFVKLIRKECFPLTKLVML